MTAQEMSALMREIYSQKTPEEKARMEQLGKEMEESGIFLLTGDSEK